MKLTIEIKTDNAAFEDGPLVEIHQILEKIYVSPDESGKIYDSNGNRVGFWEWR